MIYESESPPMPLRVCLGWVATGQEDTTRNRHCTALHFRPILIRSVVKNQLPSPRSATRLHDPGHRASLFCPFPDAVISTWPCFNFAEEESAEGNAKWKTD